MNDDLLKGSKIHITDQLSGSELDELVNALDISYSSVFVLTDENTRQHCYPLISSGSHILEKAELLTVKSGEASKSLETARVLWAGLLESGADRHSLLINLGGGMISDLGAFVASVFKRGISFINIPTSLIGQIDAAIGGKTAINLDSYKNQVGSFSFPEKIIINTHFLKSLNKRYLLSGYAEAVKHALIVDENYFAWLERHPFDQIMEPEHHSNEWEALVTESVSIKSSISDNDPYDWNERRLLNFGHTIGHAIESCSLKYDKDPVTHGEAVASGMLAEALLSTYRMQLRDEELNRITAFLKLNFDLYSLDENAKARIIDLIRYDKKVEKSELNFTLISSIGRGVYNKPCSVQEVEKALAEYEKLINY